MVGLQGSGKTTTAAKLANLLKLKKKKVLLSSLDISRPAAIEQLNQLSQGISVDYMDNDPNKKVSELIEKTMEQAKTPKILVINKIDLVEKPKLLNLISEESNKSVFKEIIPVSALKEDGMELLKDLIIKYLPEGPEYFPKEMVTDCTENFLFKEIIREKVLNLTRFEVPHSVAVIVENMEEQVNGVVKIDATLYTEKASQKKILIGRGGKMLKSIGRVNS